MHIGAGRRGVVTAFVLVLSLVAGCGGGGGGGDDDDAEFDNEATGIWTGTHTPDGKTGVSALFVAEPNGRFAASSSLIYLSGTGSVSGDQLSATATGWPPSGTSFGDGSAKGSFSLTGFLFEENRSESSYSGAGESGRFVFTYDATRSNRPASLALVAGSYVTSGQSALAINSNGVMTLNSPNGPNCVGNGQVSVPDASRNVYAWSMTFSGCTSGNGAASGVGFMEDFGGVANSRVVLAGATVDIPVIIIATK
jgi:hypothetical protein